MNNDLAMPLCINPTRHRLDILVRRLQKKHPEWSAVRCTQRAWIEGCKRR